VIAALPPEWRNNARTEEVFPEMRNLRPVQV